MGNSNVFLLRNLKWQFTFVLSLSRFFPNRYCLANQNRWYSGVESFHLSQSAIIIEVMHSRTEIQPLQNPLFSWLLHLFDRSYTPFHVMSYNTPYKIGVYGSVSPSSGQKGKRAEPPKVRTGQKQKCQHFPAIYCLIYAIFSGKGCLGMLNAKVKFKMASLPVWLAKQEVPAFSCL